MTALPERDGAYRAYVREQLQRTLELIAYMSFGDYTHRIDPESIPHDEFAELYSGLDIVMDDLAETRRENDVQHELATLRGELWRLATSTYASCAEFIQALLDCVGPRSGAIRASYYAIDPQSSDAFCTAQWHLPDHESTIGLKIPAEVWQAFKNAGVSEIDFVTLTLPVHKHLAILMERGGIKSIIVAPVAGGAGPLGWVSFSHDEEHHRWTEQQHLLVDELAHIIVTKSAQIEAERLLRDANARLEIQVASRTRELAEANTSLQLDIQRRERAEQALREREELYRGLVETSPDAIIVSAPGGGIVMVNGEAVTLFGAAHRMDLMGREYRELVAADDRDRVSTSWLRLDSAHRSATIECRFTRLDGTSFLAEARSIAVGHGTPQHTVLTVVRDITARRRQEEELFRTQKLESLGLLAGGIAHDFNNVLTGIVSNLAIARAELDPSQHTAQVLADAEEAAIRATGLTRQLLTFARGGAPIKSPLALADLVESAARFCLSGSSVKYVLDMPPGLMAVEVDRGQIDQVLNNLFINAVQAMPQGGTLSVGACNLRTEVASADVPLIPGNYVKVWVKDTGTGIDRANMARLFDPYFTTKQNGVGLGLTTVYSIIRRHGGAIRCESEPGTGATFTFFLPATAASIPLNSQAPAPATRPGARVLIMDDDRAVRLVLRRLLEHAGYAVSVTDNMVDTVREYREAIEAGRRYDAVVLDLTIPGGAGGRDVLRELQKLDPGVRGIVVSGYSSDPVMADFRAHGFAGMLAKPFQMNDLLNVVAGVIGAP